MDKTLVRNALQGMIRATDDDSTPIIRRLARVQARAALANLDAEAASGAGERAMGPYGATACPWCRSIKLDVGTNDETNTESVKCMSCGAHGPAHDDSDRSIRLWNALSSLPPATAPAMVADAADWIEEARKAAAATRPRSPWAKAVMRGDRDDSDEVRAAMFAIDTTRAALAAAPTIPATGEAIPEGMKPWHGGDEAPCDWDGGRVLFRNGSMVHGCDVASWQHPWAKNVDEEPSMPSATTPFDIIAYTPKATIPASGHAATEGEGA